MFKYCKNLRNEVKIGIDFYPINHLNSISVLMIYNKLCDDQRVTCIVDELSKLGFGDFFKIKFVGNILL